MKSIKEEFTRKHEGIHVRLDNIIEKTINNFGNWADNKYNLGVL